MKRIKKTMGSILVFTVALTIMLAASAFSASAHSLQSWANYFPPEKANSTYSFGIGSKDHMNGSKINYYWANSTVKSKFNDSLAYGFTMWGGMISGSESQFKCPFKDFI